MKEKKDELICESVCAQELVEIDEDQNKIPEIVNEILESIGSEESPDHVGFPMIPSKEYILEIINLVETIIYPGYFGEQGLDRRNLSFYLGNQMNKLFKLLSSQIAKCLIHECKTPRPVCSECTDLGKKEALLFLQKIPKLRKILAGDVHAAYMGDPAAKSKEEIIFCYPGLKVVTIYRIAHELWQQRIPILPRMLTEYAHSVTGADIHPGAKIGKNFFIDHATGVVIGETTEIGDNVRLYQGVTLGALSIPKDEDIETLRYKKRHPTIEDDVIIYANATILGGDTVIGRGSVIGGNVWLTHSVSPYSKVTVESSGQKLEEIKPA